MKRKFYSNKNETRSEATTIDKIYDYFKSNAGDVITPDQLVEELNISYNTTIGTLFRLYKEGKINRINKGEYAIPRKEYFDEGKFIEQPELPNQKAINEDVSKNIKIFENENENHNIRLISLGNIRWLSNHYSIVNNPKILHWINRISELDLDFQQVLFGILENIYRFENSDNGDKNLSQRIIDSTYKTIQQIILSNIFNISLRIAAWVLLKEMLGIDYKIIDIYFQIAKSDDVTWNNLGLDYEQFVTQVVKYGDKVYFLSKLEVLIKDSDEGYSERGLRIHSAVQNHYQQFYLINSEKKNKSGISTADK